MFSGQWVGTSSFGSFKGECLINIEPKNDVLGCYAYFFSGSVSYPSSCVYFEMPTSGDNHKLNVSNIQVMSSDFLAQPIHSTKDYISNNYGGIDFPESAIFELSFDDDVLNLLITPSVGSVIYCVLENKCNKSYSSIGIDMTWVDFKSFVSSVDYRNVAFRGQAHNWPLRTSFHRNGRYDVQVYMNDDIPLLHRHISSMTKHYFNLSDPIHNGAFINLLQHHGYPTPLLDWSYSPYVAAFFAFSKLTQDEIDNSDDSRKARIFVFELDKWRREIWQFSNPFDCRLNISIGEYLTLNNPRALPQQALTTFTNCCDMEGHLYKCGGETNRYLKAIDIPIKDARNAMRDLAMMGITYGALFPGIDGACQDFKEIKFPRT